LKELFTQKKEKTTKKVKSKKENKEEDKRRHKTVKKNDLMFIRQICRKYKKSRLEIFINQLNILSLNKCGVGRRHRGEERYRQQRCHLD